jgi:pimeloyl-ACP methyl ester carboxylesterase
MRLRLASVVLFLALSVIGCGASPATGDGGVPDATADDAGRDAAPVDAFLPDDPGAARAIFVLAPGVDAAFFDLPWPTDLRTTSDGHVDMTGFPNPNSILFREYLAAIDAQQVGFGTNGAMYFRFSRGVDETTLPADAMASLDPTSSVFLVDVDPDSATRGARIPITTHYQHLPTAYWAARSLAVRAPDGLALEGNHTYAAVITNRVHALDGSAFARDADFETVVDGSADAAALAAYQPALDTLAGQLDDVIALAVFTTQDATALGTQLRDFVHDSYPAPTAVPDTVMRSVLRDSYQLILGSYGPVPIFQSGEIPYLHEGGEIDLEDGTIVEGEFNARFALSVPTGAMPPEGYPIVLYSHGTGGDYQSFASDGTADRLARVGYAVMGIDQIHHGARNPTDASPELLFFNVQNPEAVRFNTLESAVDIVTQARFAGGLELPADVLTRDDVPVHFDADRVFFFGHSQGGLVAPLYLAIDDGVRGGVISAGGALLGYALLEKTEPVSIPLIFQAALGIGSDAGAFEREGMNIYHPVISVLQGWIEPSEPANYAGMIFDHPRAGFAPKSILQTEGLMDVYTPPHSIEALVVAMRNQQVAPIARDIPTLALLGIAPAGDTVTMNVAGGLATAGLLQFPDNGHFAVFMNETAQSRIAGFFESLRAGGPGVIPPPP